MYPAFIILQGQIGDESFILIKWVVVDLQNISGLFRSARGHFLKARVGKVMENSYVKFYRKVPDCSLI